MNRTGEGCYPTMGCLPLCTNRLIQMFHAGTVNEIGDALYRTTKTAVVLLPLTIAANNNLLEIDRQTSERVKCVLRTLE